MHVELDSIIYSLQRFGGASSYWSYLTAGLRAGSRCTLTERRANRSARLVPVWARADVFHSSHFRCQLNPKTATVTTAHDLTYELGYVGASLGSAVNVLERQVSYFNADMIICVSENTKADLLNVYPSLERRAQIRVIYHGIDCSLYGGESHETGSSNHSPYILFIGGRQSYKGFNIALAAFARAGLAQHGFQLLCSGRPFTPGEHRLIASHGLSSAVVNLGTQSEQRLRDTYRSAICLLYTSTYEGFGFPPLEAMAAGCPVICSATSSLPEVVGDAALMAQTGSSEEYAELLQLMFSPESRQAIIQKGYTNVKRFTWERSIELHLRAYSDAVAHKR